MTDKTSRWDIPAPSPKLVAPWRRQPPADEPTAVIEEAPAAPANDAPVVAVPEWERRAVVILARPVAGESAAMAFARKEAELREVFATLSIADSRALHQRLRLPKEDDELVRMIGRLTAERRARLVAFVADARRREAVMMERGAFCAR